MGDDAQLIATLQKGYQEVTAALAKADQAIARVDDLRAEIARLRAGESEHPAPEGVQLTPAQWVHRWNRATGEERIARVERLMNDSAAASRCDMADHEGELTYLRQRAERLKGATARVRALHSGSPYRPGTCCCGNPSPCPTIRALDGEVPDAV